MQLGPAELLVIDGEDALAFAQAQFTSDVHALDVDRWHFSAWLDPQGRARHFFALLRTGPTTVLAWQPLGSAAAMRDALRRFVFRSRVRIEVIEQWSVRSASPGTISPGTLADASVNVLAHVDGGHAFALPGSNARVVLLAPAIDERVDDEALATWRRADIETGLPLLAPAVSGEFVPQALELERIGAIRFDKGCYPGQEIAARLHFRGGNKRRLQRLASDAPMAPAMRVLAGDAVAGSVLYACRISENRHAALAVLADEYANAHALRGESGGVIERIDI